jgi:hypothetical protein
MEQEPAPITEILGLMLLIGSFTFVIGASFQAFILYKNKKSILVSIQVVLLTRILTIFSSFFIWASWPFPTDIMFLFIFLPAVLPELILSPVMLKIFGNKVFQRSYDQ